MFLIFTHFFEWLEEVNTLLWGYLGLGIILFVGIYFTIYSKGLQVRRFPTILKDFIRYCRQKDEETCAGEGVSPLKAFFASLGGCIGIGNLATVALAVQIGGPGALVWVLFIAFLGMILKYAEIYLGLKYRVLNDKGHYEGGPMYFLKQAFPKWTWLPGIMAFMMCIYGVEIYMFAVVKDAIVYNWLDAPFIVTLLLIGLILYGVSGGVKRIGAISSVIIPGFVLLYLLMTVWVLWQNTVNIPHFLLIILKSAFTGHAAVGGFVGSTVLLTLSKGISSACYSGDVAIGYASIINSQVRSNDLKKQAGLAIFGIFLDTFIVCTCTILLILVTGVWQEPIDGSLLVQTALSRYFPYMNFFMPIFLFSLGYTTILAYMFAGLKCAKFIMPRYGARLYYIYAISALLFFSFFESKYALTVMNVAGGLLMLINLPALFRLRKEIDFDVR